MSRNCKERILYITSKSEGQNLTYTHTHLKKITSNKLNICLYISPKGYSSSILDNTEIHKTEPVCKIYCQILKCCRLKTIAKYVSCFLHDFHQSVHINFFLNEYRHTTWQKQDMASNTNSNNKLAT